MTTDIKKILAKRTVEEWAEHIESLLDYDLVPAGSNTHSWYDFTKDIEDEEDLKETLKSVAHIVRDTLCDRANADKEDFDYDAEHANDCDEAVDVLDASTEIKNATTALVQQQIKDYYYQK